MSLYTVADKYKALQQRMIDGDGYAIDTETGDTMTQEEADALIQAEIFELMSDQAEGAEVAIQMIREAEALNIAADLEVKRIGELIKSRKRRIQYAKDAMRESMEGTNVNRIETSLGNVTLAKGAESVVIKDEAKLLELSLDEKYAECVKIETVRKPVKAEIKALIKSGEMPEDIAALERGQSSIRIK